LAPRRASWSAESETFLRAAFSLVKALASDLRAAGRKGGALVATVSRMDGAFALEGGSFDPVQGGLAGLAKTVAAGWPEVRARALDVASAWSDSDAAAAAIERELAARGPVEVGLSAGRRAGIELVPSEAPADRSPPLGADDVVVVTGGARGVT